MGSTANFGIWLGMTVSMIGRVSAQEIKCPIFVSEPRCGEHEVGLNAFSWTNVSIDRNRPDNILSYGNGLYYKLHCRRNVFRLGLDVYFSKYEEGARFVDFPSRGGYYRAGDRIAKELRIGYERRLTRTKVQPFVGADLGYNHQVEKGRYENWSDFIYNPASGTERAVTRTFFIATFAGVNYHPLKHWSVTAEVSISYGVERTRVDLVERSYLNPEEHDRSWTRRGGDLRWDPLRTVGISYHF